MYSLRTLGGVELFLGDAQIAPNLGPRTKETIAALATGAGEPVPRYRLWSWLWPDHSPQKARKALNTEMWRIRQAVIAAGSKPDALIESTPQHIRLCTDRGFRIDLAEFKESLARATTLKEMTAAAAHYRGDFADGIDGDWTETIRRELRACFMQLLARIVDESLDANMFAEAQHFAERMTTEDPYDEDATRNSIRAALARGEHGAAAQLYMSFAARLKTDLDARPSAQTVALYQLCRHRTDPGPTSVQPGFRIEPAPVSHLAVAEARRKIIAIAEMITAIRGDLRSLARDLDDVDP